MSNTHIILGQHPGKLTVRLVREDGMVLVATCVNDEGDVIDWPAAPSLEFAPASKTTRIIKTVTAVVAGAVATWDLTAAQVEEIALGSVTALTRGGLATKVRLLLPDAHSEPHVHYAGSVDWRTSWAAGSNIQRVTFTVLGGGGGGGSDSLIIVPAGDPVTLPTSAARGAVLGYRLLGTSLVNGVSLNEGTYLFERDPSEPSGWGIRSVPQATAFPLPSGGGSEVVPQEPLWDDALFGYTIPDILGVRYIDAGSFETIYPGFVQSSAEAAVNTKAVPASSAYTFPVGVADSWYHIFPAISPWVTAFSDSLDSPTGEFASRSGWEVTQTGTDTTYDHAVIDGTGLYLTGGMQMVVDTPVPAVKHFIEVKYDFTEAEVAGTEQRIQIRVSFAWGGHNVFLSVASAGASTLTWNGTTGWPDMAARNGADLSALPLVGTLRVENDGTYISVFINGALVAGGLRNEGNNPSWAGAPTGYRLLMKGIPNIASKHRYADVVVGTQPEEAA